MTWNLEQAPVQTGRIAIVTGASADLGFARASEGFELRLNPHPLPQEEGIKFHTL